MWLCLGHWNPTKRLARSHRRGMAEQRITSQSLEVQAARADVQYLYITVLTSAAMSARHRMAGLKEPVSVLAWKPQMKRENTLQAKPCITVTVVSPAACQLTWLRMLRPNPSRPPCLFPPCSVLPCHPLMTADSHTGVFTWPQMRLLCAACPPFHTCVSRVWSTQQIKANCCFQFTELFP